MFLDKIMHQCKQKLIFLDVSTYYFGNKLLSHTTNRSIWIPDPYQTELT